VQIQGQDGHIYKGRIDAKLSVELKKPKNSNLLNINSHNNVNIERPNSVAHNRPISTKYNNSNININNTTNNNNNNNNNNQNNINSVGSTAKPSTPNTNVKSEVDDDQLDPIPVYTN
jgi:hypothetical protein